MLSKVYRADKSEIVPQYHPDLKHKFFVYDPDDNDHYFFCTSEDRDLYAKEIIISYSEDEWNEDGVVRIIAGEVTHVTKKILSIKKPSKDKIDEDNYDKDGNWWGGDSIGLDDYGLVPLQNETEGGRSHYHD